ncbi:hypothetical protein L0668_15755 [Paraglaciecola aquimarina]|uniref:Uncharacterized protein n=1 Tax=Paraglaciecola algarum TaxID=3050085 RepID=A0ABS9D9D7_9ALTE|nr:hypothetical protein [Paraglaciecola sp. G1-23]MCF2949576.1 hypothetical protein [Paraglaciecola sp. G1-23]
MAGIDVDPKLELSTYFSTSNDEDNEFTIRNVGTNSVGQIEVFRVFCNVGDVHRHDERRAGFVHQAKRLQELSPWSSFTFTVSDEWLSPKILRSKAQAVSMQIILRYRRFADNRLYEKRAFYFVNPEGEWVNEIDQSLSGKYYDSIKSVAIKNVCTKGYVEGPKLIDDGSYEFSNTPDKLH